MATHRFYMLDVFAEEKYAGNQLAVFRNAGDIPGETMQQIANDMHFSETTFILAEEPRDGGYDVRIFTPEEELPFAGHPTLGTAYVLMKYVARKPLSAVKLNLKVGQIPVTESDGVLWMRQNLPTFGRRYGPEEVAPAIGVRPQDIDDRFPVQEVSTGIPFIIVPLKANGCLRNARRDPPALGRFTGMKGVFMFAAEPRRKGDDLAARMFTAEDSIGEDPATGSASGCLAGYLVKHRYLGKDAIDVRVEQGYEIRRPSLLRLRAAAEGDGIEVHVGGRVVPVARGELA